MLKTLSKEIKEFKRASIMTPLFMIGEVIFEMLIPLLMASIIDNGVEKGDLAHIVKIGGLMLVLALGGLTCGLLGGKSAARAASGFARNLREAMFRNIQSFSFSNIDKYSTPSLVTRLTTDVTNLQNAYHMMLRMFTRAPMGLIIAMVLSFSINAKIAAIYLAAVLFLSCIIFVIMRRATKYFKEAFPKYDALNESVQENVGGIRVVKAYVREDYQIDRFTKASLAIYRLFIKAENTVVFMMPSMQLTVYTCIILISWVGAKMVVGSTLLPGELTSLLTYCMNILMNLMMLSFVFVMITMSEASARRICEVLDEESTLTNPENPVYEVKDGSIIFDHVSFAYVEDRARDVLHDVNISIRSGETIGVLGGTGSSKTSFINLISRLYDVSEGTVLVGGQDVKAYDLDALRKQVAVVLQKNVLFSGTVLENLRWGDENATIEDCKAACRIACADEFISGMAEGYESELEQGAANLSGGQRQRLCIARAILRKPKILILDDSTSAVDTATDAKIRTALKDELPDMTKLIIAQRISSVQDADRILVLDDGRVSAFDTHERLLETNPIYREVYDSQMNGNGDFDEGGDH